jgi:NADH-quinone oxidoreductase subunit L
MGGLWKKIPITFGTFLVGCIAIAGIPPFSGFFSKDEILWKTFSSDQGSWILWLVGIVGAALTAFYTCRLVLLTFHGEKRFNADRIHPHEAPKTMLVPLFVLAALSIVGGFAGMPHASALERWLDPIFSPAQNKLLAGGGQEGSMLEIVLMAVSLCFVACGVWLAWRFYTGVSSAADTLVHRFPRVYRMLINKYYVDEVYEAAVVGPAVKGSEDVLWKGIDVLLIDGTVNGLARLVRAASGVLRKVQTGVVQSYALVFLAGILLVLTWIVWK